MGRILDLVEGRKVGFREGIDVLVLAELTEGTEVGNFVDNANS